MVAEPTFRGEKLFLPVLLLVVLIAQLVVIFSFEGTRDSGDSIQHYMTARYAFRHPELFLDHWGKPWFTLLAALPAQLGFIGIKLFNCALILWTVFNVYYLGRRLFPSYAWLAPLFYLCMPEVIRLQFSGLTEPLFAAWMSGALLLLLRGKTWPALIMASLLPFVRTEGFLMLPVFAFYHLETWWGDGKRLSDFWVLREMREWMFPLLGLTVGTVVYSLIGAVAKGDITWVFTENPYETMDNYGQGNWLHFPKKFIFITGVPLYGLWAIGLAMGLVRLVLRPVEGRKAWHILGSGRVWRLINGLFLVYFCAHVVFWATGVAHSMGLMRVMVSLTPLAALMAVRGLVFLAMRLPRKRYRQIAVGLVLAYVLLFPWLDNPAALKLRDFRLSPDQEILDRYGYLGPEMAAQDLKIYYAHPHVAYAFGIDPWSYGRYMNNLHLRDFPPGTLIVWDNWFSVRESGIQESFWGEYPDRFSLWKEERAVNEEGREIKIKFYHTR